MLLDPETAPDFPSLVTALNSKASCLDQYKITESNFKYQLIHFQYENFNPETVLKWILPDEIGPVTGFAQCGHIIHLNLKDHHLPYKGLIGQVFLEKIPSAKTVVNKTANIHHVYRNFEFEVLAGENNLETCTKESQCSFELDFGKVYWNSRLSTEHERVVRSLPDGAVVYDVFAGIGPFAIPAAKKRCKVYANDLNPESYKWLKRNVVLNSSKKTDLNARIECFNLDGRDFLQRIVFPDIVKRVREKGNTISISNKKEFFVVMNLPAIAIEFLDAFLPGCFDELLGNRGGSDAAVRAATDSAVGATTDAAATATVEGESSVSNLDFEVTIFCYCFSNAEDLVADVHDRVEAVLRNPAFKRDHCEIRPVRNVAPKKEMLVAKIRLTPELLMTDCEPPLKRQKTD